MTWDPNNGGFTPGSPGQVSLFGGDTSGSKSVTVQDLINLGLIDANGRSLAGGTLLNPAETRLSKSVAAILQDSASSIELNSPTLFKKMNGAAGMVMGAAGLAAYNSAGTATFTIDPETGNVTLSGTITATAGAIGGFDIGADYLRDAANSFGLASTVTGGDDVRFWAGATFANRATAPMRVTEAGVATFSNISVTGGNINTTGYVVASGGTTVGGLVGSFIANVGTSAYHGFLAIMNGNSTSGVYVSQAGTADGGTFVGTGTGIALTGASTNASGFGVAAANTAGGTALAVTGKMTIDNTTLVSNLHAARATVSDSTTGSSASCTGNAATATTLQTARDIGGVSFNGSAAIDPIYLKQNGGTAHTFSFTGQNISSGAPVATFSGALPTGTAASTNYWAEFIIDSTSFWIPVWVK